LLVLVVFGQQFLAGIVKMPIANSYIQQQFINGASATMGQAPTYGSTLIYMSEGTSGAAALTSILQTGVAWTKYTRYSVNRSIEVWTGVVGAGASASVVLSSSQQGFLIEWAGVSATPDAVSAGNFGNSTTPTSATVTPTAGNNMLFIFAIARINTYSSGPTGGFTEFPSSNSNDRIAYQVVASTSGPYSGVYTFTAAQPWDTYLLVLPALPLVPTIQAFATAH
jgi:hypothetical protein